MKWISVKDSLPEDQGMGDNDVVLIYANNGLIRLGYLHNGKLKQQCDYCLEGAEITHWMPLPDPPIQSQLHIFMMETEYFLQEMTKGRTS